MDCWPIGRGMHSLCAHVDLCFTQISYLIVHFVCQSHQLYVLSVSPRKEMSNVTYLIKTPNSQI